jgi:hypothetical protein
MLSTMLEAFIHGQAAQAQTRTQHQGTEKKKP